VLAPFPSPLRAFFLLPFFLVRDFFSKIPLFSPELRGRGSFFLRFVVFAGNTLLCLTSPLLQAPRNSLIFFAEPASLSDPFPFFTTIAPLFDFSPEYFSFHATASRPFFARRDSLRFFLSEFLPFHFRDLRLLSPFFRVAAPLSFCEW